MEAHLSKTKYCNAVQCPKMLWLKKYRPEYFDESVMNQGVLDTGSEVGDLAMGLFGPFTEVPFSEDLADMLNVTEELLADGTEIIAEASFAFENCFCSVDILKNLGGGEVELYEVKSSTSVHDIYRDDVAYQYYVLTGLGYHVSRACLVHINNRYVRHGDLNLQELFAVEDLTEIVRGKQTETADRVRSFKDCLAQADEPPAEIGEHCSDPYACGFWNYCTRALPQPNIFEVAGIQNRTKWKNYRAGIISFEDLLLKRPLNANAMLQVEHELKELPPQMDRKAISDCLSRLSYPLYFLDFESFNPAVPLYDDSRPFEQIVFQYSLHYIEREGGELKHKEFLAEPGKDPRRAVAEHLCRDIPENVCTTAYNMSFERTRIQELADLYPDLADHLLNIRDGIQDLMVPFQKKQYYTRAMQGSYSIKYVLPALFPDDPALNYHNLENVHNGAEASDAFKRMADMQPEELTQYRASLLKYCGLDTYAMVKVWGKLHEAAGSPLQQNL